MSFKDEWAAMDLPEKLHFAQLWETNPEAQWNIVRQEPDTAAVLSILREIADFRSTIEFHDVPLNASPDISTLTSVPTSARLLAETDGVVHTDPRHAGGWWGLIEINRTRVDVSVGGFPMRFPPGTGSFRTAFDWLTTTARSSRAQMVDFVNGEHATGDHEHIALTFKYLVSTNAGEIINKYLYALRGHGPDEPGTGHHHHLAEIVALASDVDERRARTQFLITFRTILERFPQAFGGITEVTEWDDKVTEHLMVWLEAMGNHSGGLGWLQERCSNALSRWRQIDDMVTRLVGSRDTEETSSRSVTTRMDRMRREANTITTSLRNAYTTGGSAERTEALQNARTTVRGWRSAFGSTTTGSFTSSQGSETEIAGDAEIDILVADGSVDLQETISLTLEEKIQETINAEQEFSGSTSDTETTSMSETLRSHWQSLLEMSETYSEQITNEWRRSTSYTNTVSRVRRIADVDRQVEAVRDGIEQFMQAQEWPTD